VADQACSEQHKATQVRELARSTRRQHEQDDIPRHTAARALELAYSPLSSINAGELGRLSVLVIGVQT
jgi:hypothetical protein